jgi:tRNA-specific 2-thiouridylase
LSAASIGHLKRRCNNWFRGRFQNHDKKDSTGIVSSASEIRDFGRYLPRQPGEIRTLDDQIIARHHGLMFYTIGQREGLGIGGRHGSAGDPWYVAGKDTGRNILRVVQGVNHPALFNRRLCTGKLHWIAGSAPVLPLSCTARIRYRQPDRPCLVTRGPVDTGIVEFREPQRAVTPGQSVVFYDGEVCLGGGVIEVGM